MKSFQLAFILSLFFLLYPPQLPAETMTNKEEDSEIHIAPLDPEFPAAQMAEPGVKVDSEKKDPRFRDSLPTFAVRNRVLDSAGLLVEVSSWDHLDRDLLFIRAKNLSLEKLGSLYPNLPKSKLERFKALLLGER